MPLGTRASAGGDGSSYLDMWKRVKEREREAVTLEEQSRLAREERERELDAQQEKIRRQEMQFQRILQVPDEERRRVEHQLTVNRAAAALAAAEALLAEEKERKERQVQRGRKVEEGGRGGHGGQTKVWGGRSLTVVKKKQGSDAQPPLSSYNPPFPSTQPASSSSSSQAITDSPGPSFWDWVPPKPSPEDASSSSSPSSSRSDLPAASSPPPQLQLAGVAATRQGGASPLRSASSGPQLAFADREHQLGGPATLMEVLAGGPQQLSLPFQSAVLGAVTSGEGPSSAPALSLDSSSPMARDLAVFLSRPVSSAEAAVEAAPAAVEGAPLLAVETEEATAAPGGKSFSLPPFETLVAQLEAAHASTAAPAAAPTTPDASPAAAAATAPATEGVLPDGTRWWRESGVEEAPGGEVKEWAVVRGVSADGATEWEDKWWRTWGPWGFKEMGAEKSGRDVYGSVWREAWRESMWQEPKSGIAHIEKTADKWGRTGGGVAEGRGGAEWREKWWEHYDARGAAEKWADKWCRIDPRTKVEDGHAHEWHERWGEQFDGQGAASKWCDKWAERSYEDGTRTKWGDKWDEKFGQDSKGTRQGETWWEGAWGDRWNRTWSEGHHGTGWVHKQGRSSSGEYWDVHEPQDTWYEKKPHFGFNECIRQSWKLAQMPTKRPGGKKL